MEPWKRPVQLPLPTLEYESDLEVWKWRVKLIFKHNSLLRFALTSAPWPLYDNLEEAASATYCAALLASCISEIILADILTLSSGKEDLEAPHVPFERVGRIVKAVQMVRKDGSILLRDFLCDAKSPATMTTLSNALDPAPGKGDDSDRWRNLILVTALLVKRYKLAKLTDAAEYIAGKAGDEGKYPDGGDFKRLMDELLGAKGQK
ncbi:hypothetical protein INS49_013997 [Diaporthe citri]|uniref:uncharacterized protein n=1 Tax=Diaporthe citri TaxID=83186 RepID=UPI001C7E9591|nr:uncharacterized protein INS49_013997 [Diaporthe citri]KAG6358113.1 hypothetical protein INS49_013997 [Diaporthe citri]